ncbi:MAG: hypothetical protein MR283_03235 [Erysipelotrichaceae bacterium]|nr:hypothetical protein [Erysipelotrichaceae bacterium]
MLNQTVSLMSSTDYKDRFLAEYIQLKERYEKLHKTIVKIKAGTCSFEPTCKVELLEEQANAMGKYLYCLEIRAEVEKINLDKQAGCIAKG